MPQPATNLRTLLEAVHAGSEEAALQLVETYGPPVRIMLRRYVGERLRKRYDSEDFTQAMWASFFAKLPSPSAVDSPETLIRFLVRMAKNKVVDADRREFRKKGQFGDGVKSLDGSAKWAMDDLAAADPSPSACAAAHEQWDQLAPRDRRILELLCEGVPRDRIAVELNVHVRTVFRVFRRFLWRDDS